MRGDPRAPAALRETPPKERIGEGEGAGARRRGDWRGLEGSGCEAAKLGAGVAKGSERRLAAVFTNP